MCSFFKMNMASNYMCKICLIFLFCFGWIAAQQNVTEKTIDKQFDQALHYVNSDNPYKAIPILDDINKNSKTIGYKSGIARVGHTLAIIYFNSSDYNKVINIDDEFIKAADEVRDYEKISHIYRIKASAYSELGLLEKAKDVYSLALSNANKINEGNGKQHALGVIYGNLASFLIKSGAKSDAVFASVKQSIAAAEKIKEVDSSYISKKYSLIAYSYIILANEYLKTEDKKVALDYFQKALDIHNSKPIPLVEKVVLVNELAYFYHDEKKYDEAIKYAEMGLRLEKKASFPQLRKGLYEILSKSYLELQKTEDSKRYLQLFTALNDSISNADRKTLTNTFTKQDEQHVNRMNKQLIIYTVLSLALVLLGGGFFLYYKRKKQNQIQKIEQVLSRLKEKQDHAGSDLSDAKIIKTTPKQEDVALISPEAEEKLLEKLRDFEKQQLFLERKVSLPYVAAHIETNTKYLSYIIKRHYGKDFNKYINDLRIDYIVQKINDNPTYRQYKINVLAEEAGFSSHSKFATVFKAYVGSSPSEFIKYLQ